MLSFMPSRLPSDNRRQIGTVSKLTNAYCLVATEGSENLYSAFEAELADVIPVVKTSISNIPIVGCLCVGNRNGLLLPHVTTDQELQHLRNSLPDQVVVARIDEKFSALGNCIACNDYAALTHVDLDRETEEMIQDVLGVEVLRHNNTRNTVVALNNKGGLVLPHTSIEHLDELSTHLQVPLVAVDSDSSFLGSDIAVNDWIAFCSSDTTATNLSLIENIFKIENTFKL